MVNFLSVALCMFLGVARINSAVIPSESELHLNSNYSVGISWGHFSDCPGSTKPVVISKMSLRNLKITVAGPGPPYVAKVANYNYYQMKKLAQDKNVNFRRRTIIYAGGYLDTPLFIIARYLGKVYSQLDYNVFLLDTNWFTTFRYPQACRYMRAVGKSTAEMLVKLMEHGLDPSKVEMVGLSLGSHTISFIAKNFYKMTGTKINRLTGLDPAGPCFRHLGVDQRIDSTDADFVDILFTNIDGFGMAAPVGHVNFYINGGEFQPADLIVLPCDILCSHLRSFTLWMSALQNPDRFIGLRCDSVQQARLHGCYDRKPLDTNVLGLTVNQTNRGIFYLATNNDWPYFLGKEGLLKENEFFSKRLGSYNEEDFVTL